MPRIAGILALLLAPVGAGLAQVPAEDAADLPPAPQVRTTVLTLDQDRMFRESAWGRAATLSAETRAQELTAENRGIEQALEAEELELTTKRTSMSAEDFAPLAAAFDQKVEDFREGQDGKSRAISRQLDEDRQRFYGLAVPVLVDLLAEYEAALIIADDAVILSLSAVDVTEQAITLMDQRLPGPEASRGSGEETGEPAPEGGAGTAPAGDAATEAPAQSP